MATNDDLSLSVVFEADSVLLWLVFQFHRSTLIYFK